MKFRYITLLGMLWIVLAGCTPRVQPVQPSQTELFVLSAQQSVGQTFVARYAGLSGIQINLVPDLAGDGMVVFHLRPDALAEQDLVRVVMPLSQVVQADIYLFDFSPIRSSNQQYYYAVWEVQGTGSLRVGASAGNTYQDGAMYQQGTPRDSQLAFSLEYDSRQLAAGLVKELGHWAGVMVLSGLIFIAPGWAMLGWLWQGWSGLSWLGRVGLAGGFTLAAYAVLLVFTDLVGLHLGAWYAWGGLSFAVVSLGWQAVRRKHGQPTEQGGATANWKDKSAWQNRLADISVAVLLGLIIVTRGWAVRSIEAPMWGDSVQHTVIAQLILERGGLFDTWEPYAPYGSFGNQFGFPAMAALLAWITGMDASQAILWSGQALNVLAVICLYPLAVKLAKGERWAGVGAVMAAGLMSTMPAFYFNWGRYAQLAGQVMLPVVIWMTWDLIDDSRAASYRQRLGSLPWAKIILMGVVLSGMVMAQYRTPFFYMTFILACLVGWWIPAWRLDRWLWANAVVRLGLVALIGAALFVPWGANILAGNFNDIASTGANPEALKANIQVAYQEWRLLYNYLPAGLAWVSLGAWLWGVVKKEWMIISLGVWVPWLASVYTWSTLGVPGSLQVAPFAVLISLYIPAGLLFGWLVSQLIRLVNRWFLVRLMLVMITIASGSWLAWQQRGIAEPETYAMVTRPDMRALLWIRENIDPEAKFLVEGFRAFYNTAAVGSDAGWWLPLLGGRENSMPPLYALSSEVPLEADYSAQVVDLVGALETTPLNIPEGVALLCAQKISHVYVGQLQGLVGISWLSQSYSAEELIYQPFYQQVYHQDRVYIFALRKDMCDE